MPHRDGRMGVVEDREIDVRLRPVLQMDIPVDLENRFKIKVLGIEIGALRDVVGGDDRVILRDPHGFDSSRMTI